MKLKNMFAVPDGEKITDKTFTKVLVASVCSVLLCMGCLVGTTWAWFVANTVNTQNVIEIASVTADIAVYRDGAAITAAEDGSYVLPAGTYTLQMGIRSNATDAARPVYLLLTVTQGDVTSYHYLRFADGQTEAGTQLTVENATATVRFSTHWTQPTAEPLSDTLAVAGVSTKPTTPTTESTTPTTESTTPTTEPTTPTTEPTTPTTEPTAPTTESTAPTTESTAPTTESTAPTTESSAPTTEPTTPTTESSTPIEE